MKNDRRNFLKSVGGVTAAAAAATTMSKSSAQAQEVVIDPKLPPLDRSQEFKVARQGDQIKFALQLSDPNGNLSFAGWLSSAEGGAAYGEVVTHKGEDGIERKAIAGVKYEEITVTCGTGMNKAFYDWIKATFQHKIERKNGAIVTADFKYETLSTLKFFNALLTEVSLPALDAASKDAAYMTLKFAPEETSKHKAEGKLTGNFDKTSAQKNWLPSNFRLRIDGLDEACAKVSKIDAITIKQTVTEGDNRDLFKEPGKIEFPNLKITVAEQFSEDFYKWHEDFVIKGNNGQDAERTGKIEYLGANNATSLFSLSFKGLGIFQCAPDKKAQIDCCEASANKQSQDFSHLRRVKAEMYVEELTFDYGAKPAQ